MTADTADVCCAFQWMHSILWYVFKVCYHCWNKCWPDLTHHGKHTHFPRLCAWHNEALSQLFRLLCAAVRFHFFLYFGSSHSPSVFVSSYITANQQCERHACFDTTNQGTEGGGTGFGDGHRQQCHQLQRQLHHTSDDIRLRAPILSVPNKCHLPRKILLHSSAADLTVCLTQVIRSPPNKRNIMSSSSSDKDLAKISWGEASLCSNPRSCLMDTQLLYDGYDMDFQHKGIFMVYNFWHLLFWKWPGSYPPWRCKPDTVPPVVCESPSLQISCESDFYTVFASLVSFVPSEHCFFV